MRIKQLACVLALLITGVVPAFGQGTPKPKATLSSEFTQQLPDNTVGTITPSVLRGVLNDMLASWQQYAFVNPQAGASYTIQASDYGQLVTFNNAGAVAVTLPQATGTFQYFNFFAKDVGAGTTTITPGAGSTLCGAASLALPTNATVWIVSDGTNYQCSFFSSTTVPITYPLAVANGGTGGAVASGTLVDNISGFASTGFLTRTGAGTYAFQSATNGITLGNIVQGAANTTLCNPTAGTANWQACTGGQLSVNMCQPNIQTFTSGTNATYTTPTCNSVAPLYLDLTLVGGGGGGGGSGTAAGAATAGNATCWNTSGTACTSPVYQAGGGGAASGSAATPSTGGTVTGSGTCLEPTLGSQGGGATNLTNNSGSPGGNTTLGGGGPYQGVNSSGAVAGTAGGGNTGGGGGGASSAATAISGGGGGGGATCHTFIPTPAASYVYTVGASAAGGSAGTGGAAGGSGAAGKVIVRARWQ